jgi:hypothetical protein
MAIVLFILHSAFSFAINPIFLAKDFFSNLFVLQNGFDLKVYFPYAFGLTFAFAITAIMDLLQKLDKYFWTFAFSVATMELIGIALLVFPNHSPLWATISGIYYGFYLFLAIIFYFYIKPEKENAKDLQKIAMPISREKSNANANDKSEKNAKAVQMIIEGLTPVQIANDLNIDLSTVYRIKKKQFPKT